MPTKKTSNGFMTKKSNPIPVKRAYEISDSLKRESEAKKMTAIQQEKFGKAAIKYKKDNEVMIIGKGNITPTGTQRLAIAKKYREEASKDSTNAAKYKTIADEAVRKSKLKTKKTK